MPGEKPPIYSQLKQLGVLTTVPIILLVGPVVGYLAGAWLDRKFQIYPWLTISAVSLGFLASGREVVRLLRSVLKSENKSS